MSPHRLLLKITLREFERANEGTLTNEEVILVMRLGVVIVNFLSAHFGSPGPTYWITAPRYIFMLAPWDSVWFQSFLSTDDGSAASPSTAVLASQFSEECVLERGCHWHHGRVAFLHSSL
jgi:hypothetical protein